MKNKNKAIKGRIAETLDIPKEVTLGIPNIKIIGNMEVVIENHKGILEYSNDILRMNSASGIIKVSGKNLQIKEINEDDIMINGSIDLIEFIK